MTDKSLDTLRKPTYWFFQFFPIFQSPAACFFLRTFCTLLSLTFSSLLSVAEGKKVASDLYTTF